MNPPSISPDRAQRLAEVVAAYWHFAEKGQKPDAQEWCAHHADLLPELAEYLETQEKVEQLLAPLRQEEAGDGTRSVPATLPRFFGEYELLEEIARGGMGVVYRAREIATGRIVALKVIRAGELASAEEVERFQREAQHAAALDHPRIVPIYHVGRHEGQPFFTMKLIDGPNLNACVQAFRGLPGDAARLLVRLARAVHHAHERGLLHRDLKPANVLLDQEGEPHITDFGLARPLEAGASLTQTGFLVGTLGYMAPEQALGKKHLTCAVDVYGLGAILYALLTGQAPFQGETMLATLRGLTERKPTPPRQLNALVERDLEVICLKCLEEEPARRYVSSEALAADLERYLEGRPILARAAGRVERSVRWVRRHPARTALIAGVLLAVTLVILGGRSVTRDNADLRSLADNRARQLAAAEYAHVIRAAAKQFEDWNVPEAERLMQSVSGQSDSWEYDYLRGRCQARLRVMEGGWHDGTGWRDGTLGNLETAAISSKGKYVAAAIYVPNKDGRGQGEIRLWDLKTGKLLHTVPNTVGPVRALVFSPDEQQLLIGRNDMAGNWTGSYQGLKFTFLKLSQPEKSLTVECREPGHILPLPLVWGKERDPDGDFGIGQMFAGMGNRLWEGRSQTDLAKFQGIAALAVSPDGRILAVGKSNASIELFDWHKRIVVKTLRGHTAPIHSLAFLDNQRLASTAREPWVRTWNLTTGEQDFQFRTEIDRERAAPVLCEDGSRCLVWAQNGDSEIRALDGKLVQRLRAPGAQFISPTGRYVAGKFAGYPGFPDRTIVAAWDLEDRGEPGGPPMTNSLLAGRTLRDIAFRPDGRILAVVKPSENHEESLEVLELPGEKLLNRIDGHTGWIGGWDLSERHNLLLTAAADRLVRVWELGQAKPRTTLAGMAGDPRQVLLSPDGKLVALLEKERLGRGKAVRVWELESAKQLFALNGWHGEKPRFDEDGSSWADFEGSILFTVDSKELILPTKERLIVCDARTGVLVKELRTPDCAGAVIVNPDGKRLARYERGGLTIWDLETGKSAPLPYAWVSAPAFSEDGQDLLFRAADTWRRWNVATGKEVQAVQVEAKGESFVTWARKDQRLLLAYLRSLRQVDLTSGKETMRFDLPAPPEPAKDPAALLKSWRQQAWPRLGTELNRGYGPDFAMIDAKPEPSKATSPDGVWTVFCPERYHQGKTYRPMEITSAKQLLVREHGRECTALAFSPDSRRLASAGVDGTIKVWKLPEGTEVCSLPAADKLAERILFTADGQYLVALHGREVRAVDLGLDLGLRPRTLELRVWDLERGQAVFSMMGVEEETAKSLVFHPDGRRLACIDHGQVKLLDVPTLQEMLTLPGGRGLVAFSPDGRTLASGDHQGVRVWTTTKGETAGQP